jgi:uncharacterized protein (DUF983 family)
MNLPDEFKKQGVDLTPRDAKPDHLGTVFTIAIVGLLLVLMYMVVKS